MNLFTLLSLYLFYIKYLSYGDKNYKKYNSILFWNLARYVIPLMLIAMSALFCSANVWKVPLIHFWKGM